MSSLVSESEALSTVLANVEPLAPQQLPLLQSLHHYAAHSHHASLPQPLFEGSDANSLAAGLALRYATAGLLPLLLARAPASYTLGKSKCRSRSTEARMATTN